MNPRGDGSGWVFPNSTDFDQPFSMHATQHVTEDFGYDLVMRDAVNKVEVLRLPIKVDLAFGNDF